jgi:hypothetical protein
MISEQCRQAKGSTCAALSKLYRLVCDRREILAQAISDLIDCRLGRGPATQAVQQREVVNRAFIANRVHLHAGFFQPAREALAFVAPRIVLSGYDESGRQTLQRLSAGA